MLKLKPLSQNAIPGALEKAIRYRLLNEPRQAESICRDILETDAANQQALVSLVLAMTDQFGSKYGPGVTETRELLSRLQSEYQQFYYAGIIYERHAKATLRRDSPHSHYIAYDNFRKAMNWYEKAEQVRPEGNEDSILRWNACVRMITAYKLEPKSHEDHFEPLLD